MLLFVIALSMSVWFFMTAAALQSAAFLFLAIVFLIFAAVAVYLEFIMEDPR